VRGFGLPHPTDKIRKDKIGRNCFGSEGNSDNLGNQMERNSTRLAVTGRAPEKPERAKTVE